MEPLRTADRTFARDVFKLSTDGKGDWNYSVIYTFTNCKPGFYPQGPVTLDNAGNLDGAASAGGTNNNGTVFRLTPKSDGTWSASVLYSFGPYGSEDGFSPNGVVYFKGGLYRATSTGSKHGGGTIFLFSQTSARGWSEKVPHNANAATNALIGYP
jgi:hypothetical protein